MNNRQKKIQEFPFTDLEKENIPNLLNFRRIQGCYTIDSMQLSLIFSTPILFEAYRTIAEQDFASCKKNNCRQTVSTLKDNVLLSDSEKPFLICKWKDNIVFTYLLWLGDSFQSQTQLTLIEYEENQIPLRFFLSFAIMINARF